MTATEAEDKAKALRADGKLLYQLSLTQWVELFGNHGLTIFNELQESNYGYVWSSIIIAYSFKNVNYN